MKQHNPDKLRDEVFTNEQWEELYSNTTKKHIDLIKWLYDNHKDVLREYEKTKGKLRIEFLGVHSTKNAPFDCVACEDGRKMEDLRIGKRCASCGRKKTAGEENGK